MIVVAACESAVPMGRFAPRPRHAPGERGGQAGRGVAFHPAYLKYYVGAVLRGTTEE